MNFEDQGLALIYGNTGSGKSTICDGVCWSLFGVTAKGISADEVRSWQSPKSDTIGMIEVETANGLISITRRRGPKSDLYYEDKDGNVIRGKDATETQKRINEALGMDVDLFITASYYNEFSDTANFFIAKAKDRRELFENLAPIEFQKKLADRAAIALAKSKKQLRENELTYQKASGKLEQLISSRDNMIISCENWEKSQARTILAIENLVKDQAGDKQRKIKILQEKSDSFHIKQSTQIESILTQIEELDAVILHDDIFDTALEEAEKLRKPAGAETCPTCHQSIQCEDFDKEYRKARYDIEYDLRENDKLKIQREKLTLKLEHVSEEINNYGTQIKLLEEQENPYIAQLESEKKKQNPFTETLEKAHKDIEEAHKAEASIRKQVADLGDKIESLSQLYDLSSVLRAELLKQTVETMNEHINLVLEKYFEGEFRVTLVLLEDTLEVEIQKSGYSCSFHQLSKGQRQLLRLSMVLATQRQASSKIGIHLDNLFFDESLDGLDTDMKIRAFGMFQELSLNHNSVLVIDHDKSFQSKFDKRYHVTMVEDKSKIEEEHE